MPDSQSGHIGSNPLCSTSRPESHKYSQQEIYVTQVFYFIYRTTNTLNGKCYVGKHQTKNLDDGYIGSGKLLKRAIAKYGRDAFSFEILSFHVSLEELNDAESRLVTEEFCLRDDNYNLCVGGSGGFSYINRITSLEQKREKVKTAKAKSEQLFTEFPESRKTAFEASLKSRMKKYPVGHHYFTGRIGTFQGKKHNEETLELMRQKAKDRLAVRNPHNGSMWITDGTKCRKIPQTEPMPSGWNKGRKLIVRNDAQQ